MIENTNAVGETKDTFLINLKFILGERGLKQEHLADMLDMSPQGVSNMLKKPGGMSTETIDKIAKALNLSGPDMCSKEFRIKYLSQKKD